jgi:nitrate/nitrite-specific signal transduction histidine kinase
MEAPPSSVGRKLFSSMAVVLFGAGLTGVLVGLVRDPHASGTRTFVEIAAAGLMVALAVASLLLHFYVWRPLRRLAMAMKRAEEGDFLVRADVAGPSELSELATAFNRMLARLTEMKVEEIDTHRDLARAQEELSLKEQLEKRVRELTLLYEVGGHLTSTLELPELFSRITHLVAERLGIPQFSIMLSGADGRLDVKSAYPPGLGTEGVSFALGEGACGNAALSRARIYVPDIGAESSEFLSRSSGERENGSLVCVPMKHQRQILGVLNFQRPIPNAFQPPEIELLTAVAELAALAVSNARLHEETVALSITDPLTQAPNRRHLFQRLEMEVARANRFGISTISRSSMTPMGTARATTS